MKKIYYLLFIVLSLSIMISCGKKNEKTINLDVLICESPKENKLTEQQSQILLPFEKDGIDEENKNIVIRYLAQGSILNSKGTISYTKEKSWLEKISQVQQPFFTVKEKISDYVTNLDLSSLALEQPLICDDVKKFGKDYDFVVGFSTKQSKLTSPYSFKFFTNSKDVLSFITDSLLVENSDAKILLVYNPPLNCIMSSDSTYSTKKIVKPDLIILDKTSVMIKEKDTIQFTATVLPYEVKDEYKKVTWQSGNPSIASVNESGLVTANANNGSTIISANTINGLSATCYVTVGKVISPTSVTLDATVLSLKKGDSKQLTATVYPKDATNKEVSWESSDEKIAKVNSTGIVTAVAAKGTATIIVKIQAGDKTAQCKVTIGTPPCCTIPVPGGTYKGECKNGQPDGMGTIYYKSHTLISSSDPKERYAEAGQYIVGQFRDGGLLQGKLFDHNGNPIETIIIGGGAH